MLTDKDLADAPILVMANKQDVEGAMTATELYELLELGSIEKTAVCFQACSAKNGEGVWEGIKALSETISA